MKVKDKSLMINNLGFWGIYILFFFHEIISYGTGFYVPDPCELSFANTLPTLRNKR